MSYETGDLVTKPLGWYCGYLITHPFVCVEIKCQPGIVFFYHYFRGFLNCFRSYAALEFKMTSKSKQELDSVITMVEII